MTENNDKFKQFIFGKTIISGDSLSADEMQKLIARGKEIKDKEEAPIQREILNVFSDVSKAWSSPMYRKRREAIESLTRSSNLSAKFIAEVFDEFSRIISPEHLMSKIEGELGGLEIQNNPVSLGQKGIRLMAQPAGQVLHVASGNVFLACIDSLINGIITRNVNFVKMSTDDRDFPILFAESIEEFDKRGTLSGRMAVLWWQGGDEEIENVFKQNMDRIVFWGGQESLKSWQKNLGETAVLVRHGPKISFGVVSKAGLQASELSAITNSIATDMTMWEQKACNCPQMIFLESSISQLDTQKFISSLSESLNRMAVAFPPGQKSDDEYVELMKTRELAVAANLATGRPISVIGPKTFDWTIIFEDHNSAHEFQPSPLNRTIIIRRYSFPNTLEDIFRGHSFYLQTVGCCLGKSEIDEYAIRLSAMGVTRLCPFGSMAIPVPGTPHDGSFALLDLTRFTTVEC